MTDVAKLNVAITSSDQTDKGAKSAEKRLGKVPKTVGNLNRKAAEETEKSVGKSSSRMVRTFGEVEKAAARVFGGRSVTSGITSRLGGITQAASALGSGLGEASAAGGALEGTIGAVGIAAAGTIGVLAAAAYGAFKLADGWAKGAASIGRTADIIGVSTKALQEFTLAAERVGVDRGTAGGAAGGLSQALNDAKYGRNNDVLALLGKMGIKMQLNEDGTVNVGAMLPAIAEAMKRNNSSGRRTAARILGIPDAALPAFTQGGAALSADMADAGANGVVLDDEAIAKGKRLQRRHAIFGQVVKDPATNAAGETAADDLDAVETKGISVGRAVVAMLQGGQTNEHAAKVSDHAAQTMDRAADKMERAASRVGGGGAIGLTRDAIAAAQAGERKYGVPAAITLGQYGLESGFGRRMPRGSNNPFGIKAKAGEPFVRSSTHENINGRSVKMMQKFRVFSSIAEAFDAHAQLLAKGKYYAKARAAGSLDQYAEELGSGTSRDPRYATDPAYGQKLRGVIRRNHLDGYGGGGSAPIPVRVEVDIRGGGPGTKAKVIAGHGPRPAVSHAMSAGYNPVRGG